MANVIARPDQGIDPGAAGFAEMLEAIRAGAACRARRLEG
jgi:hypothetical protein